jgi:sugar fermentation stimulation protein A
MDLGEWREAIFLTRPNRFLAEVRVGRRRESVHVPDPGRLTELLIPGVKVRLRPATGGKRRTAWSMIGVECPQGWVNIDSQLPNLLFVEALRAGSLEEFSGMDTWRSEYRYNRSVLDFRLEADPPCLVEVKGCTLVVDGLALFPDAPTSRGTRHVEELIEARRSGFRSCLVMAVKHPAPRVFRPNRATDPAFADALNDAVAVGVEVLAYHAPWRGREMSLEERLPVEFDGGHDGGMQK